MNEISIIEVLSWVQLSARKIEVAASLSNFLILLYGISYFFNRKAVYLMAFLFVEVLAYSSIFDGLSDVLYYLAYSAMYSICYWLAFCSGAKVKTIVGYVILVLFQLSMACDAYIYPNVETDLYNNYEAVILAVHVYIISTLHDWRLVGRLMGDIRNYMHNFFSVNYNFSFFWYNVRNKLKTQQV